MSDVPLLDLMKDDNGYDRRFRRYPISSPVFICPTPEGSEGQDNGLPGLVHNLSLSGISFACSGSFSLASLVAIEIIFEAQTYSLLARIRWRRRLDLSDAPTYHYGAQFQRTEAVLRFIPEAAQFLLAQEGDRRAKQGDGLASIPLRLEPQAVKI